MKIIVSSFILNDLPHVIFWLLFEFKRKLWKPIFLIDIKVINISLCNIWILQNLKYCVKGSKLFKIIILIFFKKNWNWSDLFWSPKSKFIKKIRKDKKTKSGRPNLSRPSQSGPSGRTKPREVGRLPPRSHVRYIIHGCISSPPYPAYSNGYFS